MVFGSQILLEPVKNNVYTSGQIVKGTLRYAVDDSTKIKTIFLFLLGKLKGRKATKVATGHLHSKETFIHLYENVLDCNDGDYKTEGVYEHPFQFLLPEDIPSTYRNKLCTISYKIQVSIKKSGFFGSSTSYVETEIPVYGIIKPKPDDYDIKSFDFIKSPFLRNKNMELNIKIGKTYFTPGENIELTYYMNNETNIAVTGTRIKLIEETSYKFDMKDQKVDRKTISPKVIELPGVENNSKGQVTCLLPTIKTLYSIQHSKFFSRHYIVNVTSSLPFPHRNISVDIPVVIGGEDNAFKIEVNHYNVKHNIPYAFACLARAFPSHVA